ASDRCRAAFGSCSAPTACAARIALTASSSAWVGTSVPAQPPAAIIPRAATQPTPRFDVGLICLSPDAWTGLAPSAWPEPAKDSQQEPCQPPPRRAARAAWIAHRAEPVTRHLTLLVLIALSLAPAAAAQDTAALACYERAQQESTLAIEDAVRLCTGASSAGPFECFEAATQRTMLSQQEAVILCRCADGTEPVACFEEATGN